MFSRQTPDALVTACQLHHDSKKSDYEFIALHCANVLRAILDSVAEIPSSIRAVCAYVGSATHAKFPDHEVGAWCVMCDV